MLDPVGFYYLLDPDNLAKSGDAVYVQLIYTILLKLTYKKTGDTIIIVKTSCSSLNMQSNHLMSIRIHELIATGHSFMYASVKIDQSIVTNTALPEDKANKHCVVGIYNQNHCGKGGKEFYLDVKCST